MLIARRNRIAWIATALPALAFTGLKIWQGFGANPVEEITHYTGQTALIFLLLSLTITPARRWIGNRVAPLRRIFGLAAFGYALMHFLTYVVLDLFFSWSALLDDLSKRSYITAGFVAFVILLLLAGTSNKAAIRRLGRRWATVHRLVYIAVIAAIVHLWWQTKADFLEPSIYAATALILLALRLPNFTKAASKNNQSAKR